MAAPLRMNQHIWDYTLKDYAGNMPEGEVKLNCSFGVNQLPLASLVFTRLHEFRQEAGNDAGNFRAIKDYPHDNSVKDTIADWYNKQGVGTGWLTRDNIILGNGSFDILCNLNLLCLTNRQKVLGHAPQFTAYVDHVNVSGSVYDACYLRRENNYKFEAAEYISKMTSGYDLFIVENPNNPTGQVIPAVDMERIAKKAYSLGTILVVDEAYAEYMPFSVSAINLIPDYPNVIVTRTFSKGFGMAGMRLGYAVAAAPAEAGSNEPDVNRYHILAQFEKVQCPFNSNGIARILGQAMLEAVMDGDADPVNPNGRIPFDPFQLESVTTDKREVINTIRKLNVTYNRALKIAETYDSTPIMTLYYDDGGDSFHLQEHLMTVGLLTVSCDTYVGLDQRAARLMLPRTSDTPLLLRLLSNAVRTLPVIS